MLRLVLPKGSLEKATMELFSDADLAVRRSSEVDYRASIDDPRVDEVRILRPQEIPRYVADGMFDIGITGRDWVEETGAEVVPIGELAYSKSSPDPVRVVLCVAQDSPVQRIVRSARGLQGLDRVPRDNPPCLREGRDRGRYPALLRRDRGEDPRDRRRGRGDHRDRPGAPAAGLRIVETLLIVANRADRQPGVCRRSRAPARDGPALHLLVGCARGAGPRSCSR